MDKLATLHHQLRVAAGLLDSAASLVRDVPLEPTSEHIQRIGEALVSLAEIRQAVGKVRPDLGPSYAPASAEESAAHRRLGPVLLAAYDLAANSQLAEAIAVLDNYVKSEPSEFHREIAAGEIERLRGGDAT
jgi:hypothetical protein